MTVGVSDISTAISTQLNTAGIRTIAYLSDTFSPPVALVAIETADQVTMGDPGEWLYKFLIFVVVARADDRAGITALEGYMSPTGTTSVREALEADETLGGVVGSCNMFHAGPPAGLTFTTSGVTYSTCPFTIEVRA